MPKRVLRSLRSRIVLLTIITWVLLLGAALSFLYFLRSSQSAVLSTTEHHLLGTAEALARNYALKSAALKSAYGRSLLTMSSPVQTTRRAAAPAEPSPPPDAAPPPPLPPGPPPGPHEPPPGPPSGPPREMRSPQDEMLSRLTASTLQQEPGIEGGFYAAGPDALIGYAFPTHEGPGGPKDIPGKERPAIRDLARKAVSTRVSQTLRFQGPHDAVLFVAAPVPEDGTVTGAAWLMQRLPGLAAGRSRQALFGTLGFAGAALACALLAFLITSEVRSGIEAVLARLSTLGQDFAGARARKPQLAEFERVLGQVDALSNSLRQKIENERALEAELRHKERLSALGLFAAGIAHELRNPLATIRLRTQMSQRAEKLEAVDRNSVVVLDEVDRLDTIIERLLYFARPIRLQLQPVALDQLCHALLASWSERLQAARVKGSCEMPERLVVACDSSKLRQVLDNLVENAVQSLAGSTREDRAIVISARTHDREAQIEIADNGPGLEAEVESCALDPFFTTKERGTGLGLSVSYEILLAHGGSLVVKNRREGGAAAILTLPLTPAHMPADRGLVETA